MEQEIAKYLGLRETDLIFNFRQTDGVVTLDLITINPHHHQSFLFHSLKAVDKSEAMQKMLEYIKEHFPNENTYTMQWLKVGESKLNTSYFRAQNMYKVLDKFYYERDVNLYKIYSISLNPIS